MTESVSSKTVSDSWANPLNVFTYLLYPMGAVTEAQPVSRMYTLSVMVRATSMPEVAS